jgi:hypothetical protein
VQLCVTVPINDGELAAYTSFAFNEGEGAFCRSTLLKKLNAGDHAGACAELSRWTMAAVTSCPASCVAAPPSARSAKARRPGERLALHVLRPQRTSCTRLPDAIPDIRHTRRWTLAGPAFE